MAFWVLFLLFQTASAVFKQPGCDKDRYVCSADRSEVYCCTEESSCVALDRPRRKKLTFAENAEPCMTNSKRRHNKCSLQVEDKLCYQRHPWMGYLTVTARGFAAQQIKEVFKKSYFGDGKWQEWYLGRINAQGTEDWAKSAAHMAHDVMYDMEAHQTALFPRYMEILEDRHKKWEEATPDKKEIAKRGYEATAKKMYYRFWLEEWNPKGAAAGVEEITHFAINIPASTRAKFASETAAMDPTNFDNWQLGVLKSCTLAETASFRSTSDSARWRNQPAYTDWKELHPEYAEKLDAFLEAKEEKRKTKSTAHIGYSDMFDDDEEYSDDVQSGYYVHFLLFRRCHFWLGCWLCCLAYLLFHL